MYIPAAVNLISHYSKININSASSRIFSESARGGAPGHGASSTGSGARARARHASG